MLHVHICSNWEIDGELRHRGLHNMNSNLVRLNAMHTREGVLGVLGILGVLEVLGVLGVIG